MPRIQFHSEQVFEREGPGRGPRFAAGSFLAAEDVGEALGEKVGAGYALGFLERWVRRGVASYVLDEASPAVEAAEAFTAPGDEADAPVEIPEDWRDLSWPAKRKLAASVSDSPIRNGDDADAAIEAFLAK